MKIFLLLALLCGVILGFSALTLLSANRIDGLEKDLRKMSERIDKLELYYLPTYNYKDTLPEL